MFEPTDNFKTKDCRKCGRRFGSTKLFDSHLDDEEILELGVGLARTAEAMNLSVRPVGHNKPKLKGAFLDKFGIWRQHGNILPSEVGNGPETSGSGATILEALG